MKTRRRLCLLLGCLCGLHSAGLGLKRRFYSFFFVCLVLWDSVMFFFNTGGRKYPWRKGWPTVVQGRVCRVSNRVWRHLARWKRTGFGSWERKARKYRHHETPILYIQHHVVNKTQRGEGGDWVMMMGNYKSLRLGVEMTPPLTTFWTWTSDCL